MRNAWGPETIGLIATIATAVLIRLIDHYFPNLVNEARRVDRSRDRDRPRIVNEGEDLAPPVAPDREPGPPGEEEP
ncbi:MAG: hypothetical protein J2P43_01270 [Candidatus Dormibacteraeota bacterium]|nr:hypothetical protein [Candidatus Dormibacteraeota bacterium]